MRLILIPLWGWTILMSIIWWPMSITPLIIAIPLSIVTHNAKKAKGDTSIESCKEYLKEKYYYKK